VVDPGGDHWVKFVVTPVPVSPEKPHGIDYSLTLHGPDGGASSGLTTLIQQKDRVAATLRIIGTDCGWSNPMSTRTRPHC
jgi:hypothetical protein